MFPFANHFTLREADAIERLRDEKGDRELLEWWNRPGGRGRPVRKSTNEIGAYLERNPRTQKNFLGCVAKSEHESGTCAVSAASRHTDSPASIIASTSVHTTAQRDDGRDLKGRRG
jgi:hypothetical protein